MEDYIPPLWIERAKALHERLLLIDWIYDERCFFCGQKQYIRHPPHTVNCIIEELKALSKKE